MLTMLKKGELCVKLIKDTLRESCPFAAFNWSYAGVLPFIILALHGNIN